MDDNRRKSEHDKIADDECASYGTLNSDSAATEVINGKFFIY